jgi:uncharacterized protein YndB with AHSA1/START domain
MNQPSQTPDRIERSIHIQAPPSRVWHALTDAAEFGTWFGVDLAGQRFAPGQRVRGPITIEGYRHIFFDVLVDRMEAGRLMSWRWHPHAVDPQADYTQEAPTLVTFTLEDLEGGTLLRVVESGFAHVAPERRFEAFRMNTGGWEAQLQNIERHAAPR